LVVTLLPFPDSQTAALAERGSALPCQFHAQLQSQCAQRAHHRAQRQRASAGQLATHHLDRQPAFTRDGTQIFLAGDVSNRLAGDLCITLAFPMRIGP